MSCAIGGFSWRHTGGRHIYAAHTYQAQEQIGDEIAADE
jgi:hypothetical protein